MRIDTCSTIKMLPKRGTAGRTVIVVDTLRCTTSIIWALKNGACKVVPANEPGVATAFAVNLGISDCVLAGERGGVKLPDFELGNSPQDFTSRMVWGKNVVMSTTNGTAAINAAQDAKHLLIGGMINRTSAAKAALAYGRDVLILCAGTDGMDSAEDLVTAGAIIEAMARYTQTPLEQNDLSQLCTLIYEDWAGGRFDLSSTFHYARLVKLGFEADVDFCLRRDMTTMTPECINGIIIDPRRL